MQVTLKRADYYARMALQAANEIRYEPSLTLSIYSASLYGPVASPDAPQVQDQIRAAREKLQEQHENARDLLAACYAIRRQLAQANLDHGISVLLTDNARLVAEESRTRDFIHAVTDLDGCEKTADAALAKAQALRQPSGERVLRREGTVSIALTTDEDLAWLRKEMRRIGEQRAANNDALTAANVAYMITLSDHTMATLRRMDILPS